MSVLTRQDLGEGLVLWVGHLNGLTVRWVASDETAEVFVRGIATSHGIGAELVVDGVCVARIIEGSSSCE